MDLSYTDSAGKQVAVANVTNVTTTSSSAPSIALLKITDYGASVNGEAVANFNAIKQCYLDARAQGAQVEVPAGKYVYKGTVSHDGITVYNNGELQGVDADSGYCMKGANPKLIGGTLSHYGNTVRGTQIYHHGLAIYDQTGVFEVVDVRVVNPAAAGICVWDARDGRILGCVVEDCLADGMHHVSSGDGVSGNIYERGNVVKRCGDDMLSFVTYMPNANVVHDVEVWNFRGEENSWGRGITIQGAERIVVNGAVLNKVRCFGMYCGIEQNYGTVSKCDLNDVKVDTCGQWSQGADTQDGLLISGWTSTTVCNLKDVVISKPMRHGVLRYHEGGNTFTQDNVIYDAIPGQDVYTVPSADAAYAYPSRFARFDGPRKQD